MSHRTSKRRAVNRELDRAGARAAAGATALTVAVKVTDCPKTLGLVEEVSVVVVRPG